MKAFLLGLLCFIIFVIVLMNGAKSIGDLSGILYDWLFKEDEK